MKKLVVFSTLTGNTEKIANAVFSSISGEKSLKGHISLIETSNSGTTFVVTTGAREFEII